MRDRLLVWGSGLMALSLALTVFSAALLPRLLETTGSLTGGAAGAYALVGWLQLAALVLGAALVAGHVLLRELVPAPVAPAPPAMNWYE